MEGFLKYFTLVVVLGLAVSVEAQIDPRCPPPGSNETVLLPHESDCTKYYVCDHGILVLMECPDGLHWNVERKVCDHPWSAGCESRVRAPTCPIITNPEDPPIFHPHESDCTKYYVCDNGVAVMMECPDGLHWNAAKKACDHRWSAGCQSKVRGPTCPIITNPEDPPIFHPHESDCTKYYVCDNGLAVMMECPDGLHWNAAKKACDHRWSAGCQSKVRGPTCPIITNPEDPPIFHPHESDCTKYYVCDNGVAVVMECPDGLHWNAAKKVCDHPWSAGCQSKVRGPTCPIITNPEDPPIFHPHESDCTKYYVCDNGVAVVMECPDDLHWNAAKEVCDHPWSAGCQSRVRGPTCPIITNPEDPPIFHPHESDCTKYYVCDNGVAVVMECPDGLHWNAAKKVCDHPWSAGCKSKVQKPKLFAIPKAPLVVREVPKVPFVLRIPPNCLIQTNPEDPAIFFPHESDCSKYYECTNGVAVVMDCPAGLHWNDKLKVCDFPASAGCKTGK